jgi:hypothetical protein
VGIDLNITKGTGFTLPLLGNEELYEALEERIDNGEFRAYSCGISGSYRMGGVKSSDVIWVAPQRLVESEYPKESDGFAWSFDDELTAIERESLRAIALDAFDLKEPKFGHFVALMIH